MIIKLLHRQSILEVDDCAKNCFTSNVTLVTYPRIRFTRFPSPNGASQEKEMKRAIRLAIVVVGLMGAYTTIASAFDGGPIPMCNPYNTKCQKWETPSK
jgi:hypothetical protein